MGALHWDPAGQGRAFLYAPMVYLITTLRICELFDCNAYADMLFPRAFCIDWVLTPGCVCVTVVADSPFGTAVIPS